MAGQSQRESGAAPEAVEQFVRSWADLRTAVGAVPAQAFARPSGCAGWLVRDLVCHLVVGAQDVLITLVTPTTRALTHDDAGYWTSIMPPEGADPLDELTVRLAAAYEDPALLTFHLEDVGSAAGRAAALADPGQSVCTQDKVLTVADFLSAYVLEWTLHHLDLVAGVPDLPGLGAEGLAYSRALFERVCGMAFPRAMSDRAVLLVGTGRRAPTTTELGDLGALATRLPYVLG